LSAAAIASCDLKIVTIVKMWVAVPSNEQMSHSVWESTNTIDWEQISPKGDEVPRSHLLGVMITSWKEWRVEGQKGFSSPLKS